MKDAPETDEPVFLKAGDDISVAVRHGDEWFAFDVEDPSNVRYVHAPSGWMGYPRNVEEAERMREEVAAWTPQRTVERASADLVAINREIAALDAAEQAEQRRAAQRQADERDAEAEAKRLQSIASGLVRGAT